MISNKLRYYISLFDICSRSDDLVIFFVMLRRYWDTGTRWYIKSDIFPYWPHSLVNKKCYYMAQATSREIACYDWLSRVTCRSVIFRIGPVRITGFVSHFVYKGTTKETLKETKETEKPRTFNEFSKLSTKSSSRTMNNLKEYFAIMTVNT